MVGPKIAVFDFFCGCGGTSEGFREAGMGIVWASDVNPVAARTYQKNFPAAKFVELDVNKLNVEDLKREMDKWPEHLKSFCGCTLRQPFTTQKPLKTKGGKEKYFGCADVYGFFGEDRHTTGLVFQCISCSNGRFGCPEQDRAISVCEETCVHGFPGSWGFAGTLNDQAKLVGSTMPVQFAEVVGKEAFRMVLNKRGAA